MAKVSHFKAATLQFVALLRGINVGGNRIIKSADLKACFEKMGFRDVRVILQSGNVKFASTLLKEPLVRNLVEAGLSKQFGYSAKAIVMSCESLDAVIAGYPFDVAEETEQHYVVFLTEEVGSKLMGEVGPGQEIEQVRAGRNVIYWRVRKGMTTKSDFGKLLTKSRYKEYSTVRNLNTLIKIARA